MPVGRDRKILTKWRTNQIAEIPTVPSWKKKNKWNFYSRIQLDTSPVGWDHSWDIEFNTQIEIQYLNLPMHYSLYIAFAQIYIFTINFHWIAHSLNQREAVADLVMSFICKFLSLTIFHSIKLLYIKTINSFENAFYFDPQHLLSFQHTASFLH